MIVLIYAFNHTYTKPIKMEDLIFCIETHVCKYFSIMLLMKSISFNKKIDEKAAVAMSPNKLNNFHS